MGRARIAAAWAKAACAVTCAVLLSTIGCGGDGAGTGETQTVRSALDPSVSVSVGQASYAVGAIVTVTYAGLPGNADDWIALAPAGSPNTTYRAYLFTNGQTSGTASIVAPAGGTYVARAFPHNTFALLAESTPFELVTPTVGTDQPSYAPGSIITVSYSGLPGYSNDWIALAPAGSPNTTYLAYVFTNGQTNGTASFTAPVAGGSFVIRAFPKNTFTLLTESAPITVGTASVTPSVSTDASSYIYGGEITVTYSGLPGNPQDMLVLTTPGAANSAYVASVFTNGQASGTATFTAPTDQGAYVVRAFPNNTFDLLAESQPISILNGVTVSVDQASYAVGAMVNVSYAGMPGNANDWIALAAVGAANTSYVAYVFTNGQTSGTASITAPAAGMYVARAFPRNTFALMAESNAFNVVTASVTTDQSSYPPGSTIAVTYTGMPGYADDWIALAPSGSPTATYGAYVHTNGQASGTATFIAPLGGSYVVRAFVHNTFTLLAESAAFSMGTTILSTDKASYAPGTTVTVTYAGMPGYANDWIALASVGAANTSYVAYVFTGGQGSGTATFTAPALGTYVARAFPQNTFARLAESATFAVATPPTCTGAGICGRGPTGIYCAQSNGSSGFASWTQWSPRYNDTDGWMRYPSHWATIQFPDLTGDGKADVCGRAIDGIWCATATGTGAFGSPTTWSSRFSNYNGWDAAPSFWATIQFPDVNGDGKADVCGRASDGIWCAVSNGINSFGPDANWTFGAFDNANGWHTSQSYWGTIQFPDVNGDGKADVCGRNTGGVYCALSNGSTAFVSPGYWRWGNDFSDAALWKNQPGYWGTMQFPDVNGDGKADVCARGIAGVYCATSNGTNGFGQASVWATGFSDAAGWLTNQSTWGTILFPDVNGDGKADICGRGSGGLSCGISNGTSAFSALTIWTAAFSDAAGANGDATLWGTIQYPDLNADGKADVCGRTAAGVTCGLSNGATAFTTAPWLDQFSDVNGWKADLSYGATLQTPNLNVTGCTAVTKKSTYSQPLSRRLAPF